MWSRITPPRLPLTRFGYLACCMSDGEGFTGKNPESYPGWACCVTGRKKDSKPARSKDTARTPHAHRTHIHTCVPVLPIVHVVRTRALPEQACVVSWSGTATAMS